MRRAQQPRAACYFTMMMEGDRVGAVKMSPSSCWPGLSVFRLGNDDLLAAALRAPMSDRRPTRAPRRQYQRALPALG